MLQASEGGSVSLGRNLHKVKTGQTPTPAPQLNPGGIPKKVAGSRVLTDRIERPKTPPGIRTSAIAKAGEVVISKNTLIGLCLTAFACGIVTTLAIERGGHSRAAEREAASTHQTAPTLSRTTPGEPASATPVAAAVALPPPASEPVVVKLAPVADTKSTPPPAAFPKRMSAAPAHVAAAAATPVHPAPVRAKRPAATGADSAGDAPAAPAAPAKKWVDPFEQ